ncbi:MAG: histidine--tRNA ligase [Spirochaetes bacterium]|nr:histidine--tRNA ligase [Spirochaetota bacterium]
MNKTYTKPPGIEDIFPDRITAWNFILNTAKEVCGIYNFKELIIPVFEYTDVFIRGIGTETDIVSKEMFSFEDRGGRSLTLRPEGTAGAVRAYVENGDYNRLSIAKFFYCGPMFRAERPQKGRLRQFNQFGAETFGSINPYYDFEVISMMDAVAKKLGIENYDLLINSIGCRECRVNYINELKNYYAGRKESLCEDCKKRIDRNPLRLLDCKNEKCLELKNKAPVITSFICKTCEDHHTALKNYLNGSNISYTEDPLLVRGLDYYTKTTFEFVSKGLGGQNAFAAGGRYDNLVETFGGRPTPAVGFAAGIERIMLLLDSNKIKQKQLDAFLVYSGEAAFKKSMEILNKLRSNNFSADMDPEFSGFKSQFKKADRENARLTIIIGEDEINNNNLTVKHMENGSQEKVAEERILDCLQK